MAAGFGAAALVHLDRSARFNEATAFLAEGKAGDAEKVFSQLDDSWTHGARARGGLRIAEALAERAAAAAAAPVDLSPFPLTVLARQAFERGEFEATLRLIELAEQDGRPTVELVRTAALIEQGRDHEAASKVALALGTQPSIRLARRVRHYLETLPPAATRSEAVILRDRTGRRLGILSGGGEIELVDGVEPEWVPRAVAEIADDHEGASSLRLSLDLELSALAFEAFGSYRGSIVIVDPRNGQILAATSDRRSFRDGGTPAFEELREPASIAKIMTTTAALRAGLDPDAEISRMTCNGHRRYDGQILYCPYIAGPLRSLDRALAVSCNLAFADLGVQLGRQRMLEEHRRYGFDSPVGPFPGGRIVEAWGDDRQLADLSIGLEATEITPLHAALMAAVVANDGVMPVPTLVHAEDGRLGIHPRRLPTAPGRRVMEPEWLPTVVSAMEAVAGRGTASHVAPPGFPVAMKTGTASHPRWGFHVNYIGIGPMPDARIAFCVRITHQRTSKRVRYAAQLVTRRLLRSMARVAEARGWLEEADPAPGRDRIHRWAKQTPSDVDRDRAPARRAR